ncbi:Aspartokinase [Phlyctochytrium bullatum]|nr:Aspartokinase [Phlyctochytrium bullatum]
MSRTIVKKFGGTSVGTAERMKHVASIVKTSLQESKVIVVLSAMSSYIKAEGTTSMLLEAAEDILLPNSTRYLDIVGMIESNHLKAVDEAISNPEIRSKIEAEVRADCQKLRSFMSAAEIIDEISPRSRDIIISNGEKLSARIFTSVLADQGVKASFVNLDKLVTKHFEMKSLDQSFYDYLTQRMAEVVKEHPEDAVLVVTGYLGPVPGSILTTIGRGYTDLTAALMAVATGAEELQIWKEVDGIFTADPRKAQNAKLLSTISPEEASELTYYGSEVIHPFTMEQVIRASIPIRIKNTFKPEGQGTLILPNSDEVGTVPSGIAPRRDSIPSKHATAVTIKDNVVVLNVHSNRKSVSHGFFAQIFSTLDRFGIVVDLISTSEVHVSMALNPNILQKRLETAITELKKWGTVAPEGTDDYKVDVQPNPDATYFSFRDVWATVKQDGKEQQVLENVSGFCKPGESLIIMGPSGAGKSSLLDTIGFRKTVGKWGGDIRLNGTRCTREQFIEHSGYVTSDDVEIAELTVEETMTFAANLRLPSCLSAAERRQKVRPSLLVLALYFAEDFRQVNAKGLDSNTGREVISRILDASKKRQLASIMTIHQPSYQILQQFDRLLLLAKGRVCYFGPTMDAIQYFENLNVKIVGNPAEVYAETLAEKPFEMAEAYLQSDIYKENLRKIDSIHNQLGSVNLFIKNSRPTKPTLMRKLGFWQKAPAHTQFYNLLNREFIKYQRDPLMGLSRYIGSVAIGLVFGFAFYKLGPSISAYDSKLSEAFALSIFPPMFGSAAIPHFFNVIFGGYFLLDTTLSKRCGSFCDNFVKYMAFLRGFYKPAIRREMWDKPLNCSSDELLPYPLENLTLRAMRETKLKLTDLLITKSTDLVSLNTTDATALNKKMEGFSGYGVAIAQIDAVRKNIDRIKGSASLPANFPTTDYTKVLDTLTNTMGGALTYSLSLDSKDLPVIVANLSSWYSTNFIAENIGLFKLPDNNGLNILPPIQDLLAH